jgi:hypothetical protein
MSLILIMFFCDYIRHVINLKIYHVSGAIVYNSFSSNKDDKIKPD